MENYYGNTLFSELGDLLGHDPVFYEESDVSSSKEDIMKHHDLCTLSPEYMTDVGQSELPMAGVTPPAMDDVEIDSLLHQGNLLLDKLMSENGLDLTSYPVDLADVDELISTAPEAPCLINLESMDQCSEEFFPLYDEYDIYKDNTVSAPESPLSTLPSEPSSPVSIPTFTSSPIASLTPVAGEPAEELDLLLKTLLDDDVHCSASEDYYNDLTYSPESTTASDDLSSAGNWDSASICSSEYSPTPAPRKTKGTKKSKSTPYSKLPAGRKERKKQQNKEAAIRYRQKKRGESQTIAGEEAELTNTNNQLKSQVLNLEREIMCMKELLSDVFDIHSL